MYERHPKFRFLQRTGAASGISGDVPAGVAVSLLKTTIRVFSEPLFVDASKTRPTVAFQYETLGRIGWQAGLHECSGVNANDVVRFLLVARDGFPAHRQIGDREQRCFHFHRV